MGETPAAFTNLSVLKSWFEGMGTAAAANEIGVMYCCAPPNVHMNGVSVPAAYMVRASPDYVWLAGAPLKPYPNSQIPLTTQQWATGPDNAFHWNGLGLLPCECAAAFPSVPFAAIRCHYLSTVPIVLFSPFVRLTELRSQTRTPSFRTARASRKAEDGRRGIPTSGPTSRHTARGMPPRTP